MIELLKVANENKVNINIRTLDGSYRPMIGEVINIITLTSANNSDISKQILILKTDTESQIKTEFMNALRAVAYVDKNKNICKSESEKLREREAFFYNL